MSTKEDQLKSILDLLGSSATKQEVQDAFKVVVKYVQDLKKSNEQEWSLIKSAVAMLGDKLETENGTKVNQLKQELLAKVEGALKDHEKSLKRINDKADSLQSIKGDKGDKGDTVLPDHERIVKDVLAKIPKPKDGYTPVKGVDYWDGKDGSTRVGWGAHPLVIQSSTLPSDPISRLILRASGPLSRNSRWKF